MSTVVLACDPGGTTGWATFWNGTVTAGQCEPLVFLDAANDFLHAAGSDAHVIVEKYTIGYETLKKSRQYDALYVIGALQWLAHRHRSSVFLTQMPAEAKRFTPNAKLQEMRWYKAGQEHANDALRHLYLYLANKGWLHPITGEITITAG